MQLAIRQDMTVQKDHKIEIYSSELRLGDHVEIILLVDRNQSQKPSLRSLIGAGKGSFSSPEEANNFVRGERDKWK